MSRYVQIWYHCDYEDCQVKDEALVKVAGNNLVPTELPDKWFAFPTSGWPEKCFCPIHAEYGQTLVDKGKAIAESARQIRIATSGGIVYGSGQAVTFGVGSTNLIATTFTYPAMIYTSYP